VNLADRIEAAYNKLRAEKRYQFIDIADVRDALPDVPLAQISCRVERAIHVSRSIGNDTIFDSRNVIAMRL